jgi:hypothetical protein
VTAHFFDFAGADRMRPVKNVSGYKCVLIDVFRSSEKSAVESDLFWCLFYLTFAFAYAILYRKVGKENY